MKKIDSLNLVPFIDIVLVLLVIVLTTTSFIEQSRINVDIPKVQDEGDSSTLNKDDKIISIAKDGKIYFNNNELSLEELKFQISRLAKDSSIVINGDKDSNFNTFVKIMSMLETLGYSNLFILIDKEK